jgi:hypothetical protein
MKSPSLEASEASTPSFPCWEWFKGKSQKLWFIALNCFRISSKFSLEPIHSYHSYIKIHEKNYKSSEIHPLILHFFTNPMKMAGHSKMRVSGTSPWRCRRLPRLGRNS